MINFSCRPIVICLMTVALSSVNAKPAFWLFLFSFARLVLTDVSAMAMRRREGFVLV
jgi:hypothetical protein